MKRKFILTILVLLLLFCSVGSFYLFVSKKQCNKTPSGFPFLENFISLNSCKEKSYEFLAIIYSPEFNNNEVTFDLNIINKENKSSDYLENITLPLDKTYSNGPELSDPFVGLVRIQMDFESKSKTIFNNDLELRSVIINKIDENDLKFDDIEKSISESILRNPLKEEEPSIPRTTHIYADNQQFLSEYSRYPDNQELYYFWLISFVEKNWGNTNIQEIFKEKPDTESSIAREKEYILKDKDKLGENAFLTKFTYSCKLIKDIEKNVGEIDKEIKKYYCNESLLKSSIQNLYDHYKDTNSFSITHNEFTDRILITSTAKDDAKNYKRDNNPKLSLVEAYWDSDIKKKKDLEEKARFGTENSYYMYMLQNNNIQNQCALAYAYSIAFQESKDNYYREILDLIASSISLDFSNSLKAFENSVYSSVICYKAFESNTFVSQFVKSNFYKMILLNNRNSENEIGVWENYNEYDLKTNAFILNILLQQND